MRRPAPRRRPTRPLLAAGLCALCLTLTGCEVADYVSSHMFKPAAQTNPPQAYPVQVVRAQPLDIQLDRDTYTVTLHNRTPIVYQNVEVWLNREFYRQFDQIALGSTEAIPLESFVNEHGERFPVGSILEPEKAIPLIKADLVRTDTVHALTVRLEEDWQRTIRR